MTSLGHAVAPVADGRSYMHDARSRRLRGPQARRAGAGRGPAGAVARFGRRARALVHLSQLLQGARPARAPRSRAGSAFPTSSRKPAIPRRRANGDWAAQVACARESFGRPPLHFCYTQRDREGIAPWCGPRAKLVELPPFIDAAGGPVPRAQANDPPHLVAVGMMRPGNKAESYIALAQAMALIADRPWRLSLFGDGTMRNEIEAAFAGFAPGRVSIHGARRPGRRRQGDGRGRPLRLAGPARGLWAGLSRGAGGRPAGRRLRQRRRPRDGQAGRDRAARARG